MDNPKVTEGINDILSKFETPELLSLASTVTQGLLRNKLETREGAIEAISKYSPTATAFLKRKAVTRDSLFLYLHENDIPVKIPITKEKLIEKILQFWDCTENGNAVAIPSNFPQIEDRREPVRREITNHFDGHRVDPIQRHITHHVDDHREDPTQRQEIHDIVRSEQINNGQITIDVNLHSQEHTIQLQNTEIDTMAEKFTEWFYTMMNQNECMDTEHFYPDSKLIINLISNNQKFKEEASNNTDDVVRLLFRIKQEHNLYFNPNLTKEGTRGRMDPHGLVIIKSCGTLHINNLISGVFEQMFALARDPFSDNNWKIKNTELTLRSGGSITQQPRLCDSESQLLEIRES